MSSCPLPLREFELLALLLANAGRVLTRDTLIDRVWGSRLRGRRTKTLDVHVKRLRGQDRSTDPGSPTRIVTIRGLGYRYSPRDPDRPVDRCRQSRSESPWAQLVYPRWVPRLLSTMRP